MTDRIFSLKHAVLLFPRSIPVEIPVKIVELQK